MQAELMYRKPVMTARKMSSEHSGVHRVKRETKDSRETIHSGHFMVSDFEAEAQDDEDELAVPVPEEEAIKTTTIIAPVGLSNDKFISNSSSEKTPQQLSIETSLNKLFQCMSLAYRQKLTSPKWNRFKGIRLRWKDKIRLNNVIWRCWHMQFILKQNTLVCQFASPLDVDTHNKPEAVVLEGKYWKRKLAAVTAEYKKWRMFYRNKILGWTNKDGTDMLESMDMLDWSSGMGSSGSYPGSMANSHGNLSGVQGPDSMMVDEDYMELMTDTLFSTISSNQPIYFPDPREIARGASLADFIQPSLGPLQPNLDDFMDTLEPLQEFLNSKLPPVPEEEDIFRTGALNSNYSDLDLMSSINQESSHQITEVTVTNNQPPAPPQTQPQPVQTVVQRQNSTSDMQSLQYTAKIYTQPQESTNVYRSNVVSLPENYSPVRPTYESNPVIRDKIVTRPGRTMTRGSSRVIQQQQQQQQPPQSFNQPQQVVAYPQQHQLQTSPRTQFNSLELQPVHINSNSASVAMSVNASIDNQVHSLISPANFNQIPHEAQQRAIRPLPSANQLSDPFKIIQPQQTYKISSATSLPQSSFSQQYKFRANNIKTVANNPVTVAVSTPNQSTAQSHILLQCKPSGLDLTASPHQAKLLPRPSNPVNVEKEDIFAVPKYQMKARSRSRSSSALSAQRSHPPPLVSAVSDPTLNVNNNVLLAHLLTNNSSGLYTVTSGPDKIIPAAPVNSATQVKNILPMLPPTTLVNQVSNPSHISTPISIQPLTSPTPGQSQTHQRPPTSNQVMLNPAPSHQAQGSPGSPNDSTNAHSPQALSISPLHSPMSIGSPLSPSRIFVKGEPERGQYKEQRRVGHIHAEQKRRYNIKNGFDMLHSLIPQLSQNPNTKLSKAAMLQKGADYIRQLRTERNQLKEEMDNLRKQIETLNTSISNCQSLLPATGAPVSRQRTSKMKEMYDEYVRKRTQENWKFWIFSKLLEPLLISFNSSVSTASIDDLCRSTMIWVEQSCSLVDLRPAVLNSLRYLCTATDILSDPSRLPEEALAAVNRTEKQRSTQ